MQFNFCTHFKLYIGFTPDSDFHVHKLENDGRVIETSFDITVKDF